MFLKVLINDFKFSSNPKITSTGFVNKLNLLLKNITSEGDNSTDYKNKFNLKTMVLFFMICLIQ